MTTGSDRPVRWTVQIENNEEFQRRLAEHEIVIAQFRASWSRPCQQFDAALEQAMAEHPATVLCIDVEDNPVLAAEHDVSILPTVLLFREGEIVARVDGVRESSAVTTLLHDHQ